MFKDFTHPLIHGLLNSSLGVRVRSFIQSYDVEFVWCH